MNDTDRIIEALHEQTDIMREVHNKQKKPRNLLLRGLIVFAFGFAAGTFNEIYKRIRRKVASAIADEPVGETLAEDGEDSQE